MGSVTGNERKTTTAQPAWDGSSTINPIPAFQHELTTDSSAQNPAAQKQDYRSILARATKDAVRDLDLVSGRITWHQGLLHLLGYDDAGAVADFGVWLDCIHPEDRPRVNASWQDALAGKDDLWTHEYRFRHAAGSFAHVLERAAIIRDDSGRAIRVVGSLMDVSERKQLQDQLCRSQKMEAFGQLAGGAAHDFNNFLTTILGYSDLVISEVGARGLIARHVEEIRKAAGRASNLTAQLLAFSRKQALEPHVLDVNAFIHNLNRSLLPLLGDNVRIVCRLHPGKNEAFVRVDPGQLTQIVLNLAVNARDAMTRGGEIVLETQIVSLAEGHDWKEGTATVSSDPPAPGEYVVIRIVDQGAGMSDDVKAHLFEPFFTTKSDRGASGLGLATTYGIIRQSGGRIVVQSEAGKGTTVEIYLPRVAPPSYTKPANRKMPAGTETVLVLEDDVSVRHLSVRVLRNLGYKVIEAATGDDAQRVVCQNAGEHLDLLLTDVVMPEMSGRHFADWLRKVCPGTKIVFVSGYLDESVNTEQPGNGVFFLPKPFDQEQLAQTVRRALDS